MNTRLLILIAFFFGTICSASAQPGNGGKPQKAGKEKKADKKKEPHRELNPYEIGKLPGTVYVFGFSQEFGDTIASSRILRRLTVSCFRRRLASFLSAMISASS